MIEARQSGSRLYKGHYFIVFYDLTDEYLTHMFDNVRDIVRFLRLPLTRQNILRVSKCICIALKTNSHITKVLNKPLRVYIIDTK